MFLCHIALSVCDLAFSFYKMNRNHCLTFLDCKEAIMLLHFLSFSKFSGAVNLHLKVPYYAKCTFFHNFRMQILVKGA